jgi:hypothetical protein
LGASKPVNFGSWNQLAHLSDAVSPRGGSLNDITALFRHLLAARTSPRI